MAHHPLCIILFEDYRTNYFLTWWAKKVNGLKLHYFPQSLKENSPPKEINDDLKPIQAPHLHLNNSNSSFPRKTIQ